MIYNRIEDRFRPDKNNFKAVKYIFFFLLLFWSTGFLFPVLSPSFAGKAIINQLLNYNYSIVCHQSESSEINFGGAHLLVCARCAGIYLGALFIAITMLFNLLKLKLSLIPLLIFSAPLVIDAFAVRLNIYAYSKTIAFITGLLCGAIVIIYILETIENSFNLLYKRKNELQ
ncbi:MAG: DUF2085 domain-containing protein [Ignavibacteriaceae bacterium]|jgi:uncharacterized membrane protein